MRLEQSLRCLNQSLLELARLWSSSESLGWTGADGDFEASEKVLTLGECGRMLCAAFCNLHGEGWNSLRQS
jgi:hypothetical protein